MALCLLAGFQNLAEYIRPEFNVILCLMAAPFVFKVWEKGSFSYRYAVGAVLSLAIFAWLHMQVFFMIGVGMSLLFIVESRIGKLGALPLVVIGLLSPVIKYMVTVFTFPLRLKFSAMAAWALSAIGREVSVSGNVFLVNGNEFSVDLACLGLNTIISGFIFTTLIIAFAQQNHGKRLKIPVIMGLYGLAGILLIGSNLIRIICLVLFKSMPDTVGHELIGLFCHAIYVLLPIYMIVWALMKHDKGIQKIVNEPKASSAKSPQKLALILTIGLILIIGYFNLQRESFRNKPTDAGFITLEIPGFEKSVLDNGIAKFENDSSLIYLKPPARFWGADHTPAICWSGSGFNFAYIHIHEIKGQKVYLGQLEKDGQVMHTAWWYDNGVVRTHDQLQWRWLTLTGNPKFRLINVAAWKKAELLEVCGGLL